MTEHGRDKDPREIEADIADTRTAISDDLHEIGQRLSPDNLKEQMKEHAKQEFNEAKVAAYNRIRAVKDDALETVNETVHNVGVRAKHAGEVTLSFAKDNAIPLALIGLGVGWLFVANRRRAAREPARLPYYSERFDEGWDAEREPSGRVQRALAGARERVSEVAEHAGHGIGDTISDARERAHDLGQRIESRARDLEHRVERRAREVGHRAQELGSQAQVRMRRAGESAVDYAQDNPVAIGAAAMAAGFGVGLLLPATRREDAWLGHRRDRLVGDVRESVQEVGRAVKETASELKSSINEPARH